MPTDFKYGTRPGAVALLTTELNSLANGSVAISSGAMTPGSTTNLTSGVMYGDLWFTLGSSSSALVSGSFVAVYFLPAINGSNYPKQSSTNFAKPNYLVGYIYLYPATLSSEVIREGILNVPIPNVPFKVILENHFGVALPSSGNTLDLYPQFIQY